MDKGNSRNAHHHIGTRIAVDQIKCVGTQSVMDREIAAAAGAGLSYWAFVREDPHSSLSRGWDLYQSSKIRDEINWTWITQLVHMSSDGLGYATEMQDLCASMTQMNFLKISWEGSRRRPVLFILWRDEDFADRFQSNFSRVANMLESLRSCVRAHGFGAPYYIIMTGTPSKSADVMKHVRADAIATYVTPLAKRTFGSYEALADQTRLIWASMANTGAQMIPTVMTGFDRRPWLNFHDSRTNTKHSHGDTVNLFYAASTPPQFDQELLGALDFMERNKESTQSKLLLVYAWDECEEAGASLVPTLGDPSGALLRSVHEVLGGK